MVREKGTLTQGVVLEWLQRNSGEGWFTYEQLWRYLNIETRGAKDHLYTILARLVATELVEAHRATVGKFRLINKEVEEIDWQDADPGNTITLRFPFQLEKYATLYPQSIVIVAGSKQAGKTAFLYNVVRLNMNRFKVDLYNSETGREQMKVRFAGFDPPIPSPAPFRAIQRYDNFSDVIDPYGISVIDYLDMDSEVYMVGAEINKIFKKLKTGAAIIGLQKPPGRDLAIGGIFTAKRAALYLSLDANKLKILYCKTPTNGTVNPDNMQFSFNLEGVGVNFRNIRKLGYS